MRALVTGGGGFIGSNIVRKLLDSNFEVRVLDNFSSGHRSNLTGMDIEVIEADILDGAKVDAAAAGVDVIFHLAASVGRQKSIDFPQQDSMTNVIGAVQVIAAMKKHRIPRIVYSSSAAIYGELTTPVIAEDHPQAPDSPYGVSKLAAEKHILAGAALYGYTAICLRYFNVYGIHQRYDAYGNVIPIFANKIFSRLPLTVYGDGQQTRDFIQVRDVAQANFLAGTMPGLKTDVFNVGSGSSISINALLDHLREICGESRVRVEFAPKRIGDVLHCKAEIAKLQNALHFTPGSDIKSGLAAYLEWFEKNAI